MPNSTELSLVQINDVHAYLDLHPELFWEQNKAIYRKAGGYARIAALVEQIRKEKPGAVLFLDNGDTLHGTYPAVQTQGQALIPILNRLGLDAMTAHWEFAYGPNVFQQRAAELNYPVLALNVKQKESGARIFRDCLVKEVGGLRVGIIGLASNIVDKTMPPSFSEGLSFDLGKEDLPAAIHNLRQERVDLVVLLSHLGFPQDLQLALDVPGLNVILSGHTHNRLSRPVHQGETLIIQSGSHGSFLGQLDLTIENGKVTDYRHQLIEVAENIRPNAVVDQLCKAALEPFEDELNQVVGETAAPLDRSLNLESTMDNLLLESIAGVMETSLAFSNGWRYGAPILGGPITLNHLYNIIPVNPPVSTAEISGRELIEMLEENLENTYSRDPYRQMGGYVKRSLGIKVFFKVENPYPHRIQKLFVGRKEVQPDQMYKAAYVTAQGVPAKYGQNHKNHEVHAVEAIRQYLEHHCPVEVGLLNTFNLI